MHLAEGVGFEPTIRLPVYTLSKRAPSATRPSLRGKAQYSDLARSHNPGGTAAVIIAKACNFSRLIFRRAPRPARCLGLCASATVARETQKTQPMAGRKA